MSEAETHLFPIHLKARVVNYAMRTHSDKLIMKIDFDDVCKALLDADPDIRDIILFGDDLEQAASDSQNPVNIEGNGDVS